METRGRKKVFTEEEQKAKKKEWNRRNYEENKAKKAAYVKEYRKKPEVIEANKGYDKKKKSTPGHKKYAADYQKEYISKRKDGLHHVYLLKDHHYIGVTDDIIGRFSVHRTQFKRNTDNYRIMFSSPDRQEAEKVETQYHGMGFFGANK